MQKQRNKRRRRRKGKGKNVFQLWEQGVLCVHHFCHISIPFALLLLLVCTPWMCKVAAALQRLERFALERLAAIQVRGKRQILSTPAKRSSRFLILALPPFASELLRHDERCSFDFSSLTAFVCRWHGRPSRSQFAVRCRFMSLNLLNRRAEKNDFPEQLNIHKMEQTELPLTECEAGERKLYLEVAARRSIGDFSEFDVASSANKHISLARRDIKQKERANCARLRRKSLRTFSFPCIS